MVRSPFRSTCAPEMKTATDAPHPWPHKAENKKPRGGSATVASRLTLENSQRKADITGALQRDSADTLSVGFISKCASLPEVTGA